MALDLSKRNQLLLLLILILMIPIILLILVVTLSSLLYLGVFGSSTPIHNQCDFDFGFTCVQSVITENSTTLSLQNMLDKEAAICNVICDDRLTAGGLTPGQLGITNGMCDNSLKNLAPGQTDSVSVNSGCIDSNGQPVPAGEQYRGKLLLTYVQNDGQPHVLEGNLIVEIRPS